MNAPTWYALFLSSIVAALAAPRSASADEIKARCVVQVVQAFAADKASAAPGAAPGLQIDPKLEALRPYLSKPPFTGWQKFSLLEEKTIELPARGSSTFALPNGKPATLTFLAHLPDDKGKRHRLRIGLQVGEAARPALNTVFIAPEGKVVLQVIQEAEHKDSGLLVLGTSCGEAAPAP